MGYVLCVRSIVDGPDRYPDLCPVCGCVLVREEVFAQAKPARVQRIALFCPTKGCWLKLLEEKENRE